MASVLDEKEFEVTPLVPESFEQVLKEQPFDVVIIDLQMGNYSGVDVLELLSKFDRRSSKVIWTRAERSDEEVRAIRRNYRGRADVQVRFKSEAQGKPEELRKYIETLRFKEPGEMMAAVVDDTETARSHYFDVLVAEGFGASNVHTFETVDEARKAILSGDINYDIIVLDHIFLVDNKPQELGNAFLLELREKGVTETAEVILLTSWEDYRTAIDSVRDQADVVSVCLSDEPMKSAAEKALERGPFCSTDA